MNKIILKFLLLSFFVCLTGCTGESCYDADDFGFATLTVKARYSKEELSEQFGGKQVAPWIDSNYNVTGRPLVIMIRHWEPYEYSNHKRELSAWCPWFGTTKHEDILSEICQRMPNCRFIDNEMCTNTEDAKILNAPCVFTKGVGLYALIAARNTDPNLTINSQRTPNGITMHLGEKQNSYKLYDIDKKGNLVEAGGKIYNYDEGPLSRDTTRSIYDGSRLYFKILDKFYDDNSGQYRIVIKSGVSYTSPDPIKYVINLIKEFIFGKTSGGNVGTTNPEDYGLIQKIYQGIIENGSFRSAISALLTLYIIFTTLSYLSGNIEISQVELVTRVVKISIVSALLTTSTSWEFFYNNLFVFFVGGVEEILQMIEEAGASGPGSSGIIGMMIAPQTMAKLFSLLFLDWRGFIYIILFFAALYFVLTVYFEAAVIYLTALMMVGLIISMAPIFISFMLFKFTRSLFENWLSQLISYAVQPIILFTGLVFMSLILRQEIYASLGFRVCKYSFPDLSRNYSLSGDFTKDTFGFDITKSPIYWWFPDPMKGSDFTRELANIPIPIDHFDANGDFCEAYACLGNRYPDLPFLDPLKDTRRLNNYWNGQFVQFDGLLLIIVVIYLLSQFNASAISMSQFLTGSTANESSIASVRDSALQSVHKLSQDLKSKGEGYGMRGLKSIERKMPAVAKFRKDATSAYGKLKELPSQIAANNLRQNALSSSASNAVLKRVNDKTGLQASDIEIGSRKEYSKALSKVVKDINPNAADKDVNKIAEKLSRKDVKNLPDELAMAKYGKELKKLSSAHKKEISDILASEHGNRSLKNLGTEATKEELFRETYLKEHNNLSKKGVGFIGKAALSPFAKQSLANNANKKSSSEFGSGNDDPDDSNS